MKKTFKGTKGEWTIQHSHSKTAYNIINATLGRKYKIARCPCFKSENLPNSLNEREEQETRANACLIASAPVILECLQHILELASKKCTSTMEEALFLEAWDEWTEKAKSVVNKALGE